MDNKITLCNLCENRNQPCASENNASTWEDLLNSPECLDYIQDDKIIKEKLCLRK